MNAKRNVFLGLLIGLVLGAVVPAFLSLNGWTSAQDSRQVLLRQGWNQLVWTDANHAANTALADIADDLAIVYGWQGDSQTFTRYIPGRMDISTMSMLERGSGYWLLVKRDLFLTLPGYVSECPEPTPCADCGECASLLATCVSALDECDEAFWGMSGLLDECDAGRSYCESDLTSCHGDLAWCQSDLISCGADLDFCETDLTFCHSRLSCFEDECSNWQPDFEQCCW